jgi:hypothetical protein
MFWSGLVAMRISRFSKARILLKYSLRMAVACLMTSVFGVKSWASTVDSSSGVMAS